MNLDVLLIALGGLLLLAVFFWLLREKAPVERVDGDLSVEAAAPLHCRYFPQLRQALSRADAKFVGRRANAKLARAWHKERRQVVAAFIVGMRTDFERLNRLARTISTLSPSLDVAQERGALLLGLQFWVLYTMVWVRFRIDDHAFQQVAKLAVLLGSVAAELEQRVRLATQQKEGEAGGLGGG